MRSREMAIAAETLRPVAFVPGWVTGGLAVIPTIGTGSLSPTLQYVPLIASLLILGLPHGAVDHLAVARVRNQRPDRQAVARVVGLYVVVGGAYAIWWFLAPAMAFALFIAVTWLHWGQGDLYALVELAGADHVQSRPQRVATVVVRGGLPMLVPLLAFPEWYREVAQTLVGRFAPDAVMALTVAFQADVRTGLALAYGSVVVATLAVGAMRADARQPWRLDAAETLGLIVYFWLVPPVLAIGVYFCFWHSLRHVVRLLLIDTTAVAALNEEKLARAFTQFARDALPLTLVSLALLGGLAVIVPNPPETVPEWVGLYLVFIAVVTLPHVVVVTVMDIEQGVWNS